MFSIGQRMVPLMSAVGAFCALDAGDAWAQRADDARAVKFEAIYSADILSNMRGGIDRGTRYVDNLDLLLEIDGERAFGWTGGTVFLYGLYNNGTKFSEDLVGDAQVVSNFETGVQALRLYEAWVDQAFANDRASVRVGLYDLNSEFDAIESAAVFMNSAQGIGSDFGQTGENGPSIFPVTSLAARVSWQVSDAVTLRAIVLDAVPGDPRHPKRTAIKLGDGALMVAELDYATEHLRTVAGYWRYTAAFEDQVTGLPQNGNDGAYAFVEAEFDRLALYARVGWASAGINPIKYYMGSGAVYTGPLSARPDDQLGLAVSWAETGAPYRAVEDVLQREVAIELTYRAAVTDFLTVQPDVQYIFNPGFNPELKNALVLGLRFELAWGI